MKIDLTTFLPYQLTHLATQVSNDFSSIYKKEFDLTIPQWRIMANLAQLGQSTAKQLCTQADMDKSQGHVREGTGPYSAELAGRRAGSRGFLFLHLADPGSPQGHLNPCK